MQAALDVTRALGGHLACIDVTPYPVMAGNAVMGFGESVVLFDERGSEAKNKADLTDRLSREVAPHFCGKSFLTDWKGMFSHYRVHFDCNLTINLRVRVPPQSTLLANTAKPPRHKRSTAGGSTCGERECRCKGLETRRRFPVGPPMRTDRIGIN